MSCPNCNHNSIRESTIVKYKDNGGVKIVGFEEWCVRRECNYQYEF